MGGLLVMASRHARTKWSTSDWLHHTGVISALIAPDGVLMALSYPAQSLFPLPVAPVTSWVPLDPADPQDWIAFTSSDEVPAGPQDASAATPHSLLTWVHPADRAAFARVLAIAVAGGATGRVTRELRILSRDDKYRVVAYQLRSMLRTPGVGGLMFEAVDITELREARAELARHAHDFAVVIDIVADGIAVFDATGTITYANAAMAVLLGAVANDSAPPGPERAVAEKVSPAFMDMGGLVGSGRLLVGRSMADFFSPEDGAHMLADLAAGPRSAERASGSAGDGDHAIPMTLHRVDGTTFPAALSRAWRGDSEVVVVVRDQTARLAAEAEARAAVQRAAAITDERQQMLVQVSHELRTPLHAILGYTELLTDEVSDAGQEFLAQIAAAGGLLRVIIDDVLATLPQAEHPTDVQVSSMAAADVVAQAVGILEPQAAARGITLEIDCADFGHPIITDRWKLVQVLVNLGTNAIKYGPANSTVRFECGREARIYPNAPPAFRSAGGTTESSEHWYFGVIDEGAGVSPEVAAAIFERYVRTDSAKATAAPGSAGLGLSVVATLTKSLGGECGVRGSRFWFILPDLDYLLPSSESEPHSQSPDPG